jgi:tetrapyrrole methylase family protein / MazG family protein
VGRPVHRRAASATLTGPKLVLLGLGPAGLERSGEADRVLLEDPTYAVVLRTVHHPAAEELASRRDLIACDDLYERFDDFEEVYRAIAARVIELARQGPTIYAVPGSTAVGERTVPLVIAAASDTGIEVELRSGESFIGLVCAAVGVDPISDGLQVVDGRHLPDPLPLHLPTLITQVHSPLVAAEVAVTLGSTLPDDAPVTIVERVGAEDAAVTTVRLSALGSAAFGPRTTVYVPAASVGILGLVATNRILRLACPWDAKQTHHTLISHLIEETYETVDAVSRLPAAAPGGVPDLGAYAELEEELGDLLIQVVFHSTMAHEAGAFDFEEVAEGIRRKIVARHPHVFGDVDVADADEVIANWEAIKTVEKQRASLMDDVPEAVPGLSRADKIQSRASAVGFDWTDADPVFDKVGEELDELRAAAEDPELATDELGDVLFAVVNLSRHLGVDPEIALARANDKFAARFRVVEHLAAERGQELRELSLEQLDALWDEAKRRLIHP